MTVLSLSGFTDGWMLLFLVVVAGLGLAYWLTTRRTRRRVLRFANLDLLQAVAAGRRPDRLRHLPTVALTAALVFLTIAMAGPTRDIRIPRTHAVVMLVIDVSESMAAVDVAPSRIEAAKQAGKQFADGLTAGISLGLVEFSSGATLLVAPTADHGEVAKAIDTLRPQPRTATGEGIFTALQAIATTTAVLGGGDGPPPARIVLESDGKETVPLDPDDPRGAFTAARAANEQGVQISTISFGTPDGVVDFDGQRIPVPVDDQTLQRITEITHGQAFRADSLAQLSQVYETLDRDIGYQTIRGPARAGWMWLGLAGLVAATLTGLRRNRHLPD